MHNKAIDQALKAATPPSRSINGWEALTIMLIGLKLGAVIDWPWLWVLAPWLIGIGFAPCLVVLTTVALVLWSQLKKLRR